jgi:hypothetical protein
MGFAIYCIDTGGRNPGAMNKKFKRIMLCNSKPHAKIAHHESESQNK